MTKEEKIKAFFSNNLGEKATLFLSQLQDKILDIPEYDEGKSAEEEAKRLDSALSDILILIEEFFGESGLND